MYNDDYRQHVRYYTLAFDFSGHIVPLPILARTVNKAKSGDPEWVMVPFTPLEAAERRNYTLVLLDDLFAKDEVKYDISRSWCLIDSAVFANDLEGASDAILAIRDKMEEVGY